MVRTIDILKSHKVTTAGNKKLLQEIAFIKQNSGWLRYSAAVAVKVHGRMQELGITQKQLAEKMGCTQQNISVILKGRANLTLESIYKLECALDLNLLGSLTRFVDGYHEDTGAPAKHCFLNEPEGPEYGF